MTAPLPRGLACGCVAESGAAFTVNENVYMLPQSSVFVLGARPRHAFAPVVDASTGREPSTVPLWNVVALTVAPAGIGTENESKPLLLTTRGSGPLSGACTTARAKSRFSTA